MQPEDTLKDWGSFLDYRLNFSADTKSIFKKSFFLLGDEKAFNNITSWYGRLSCKNKNTLASVVNLRSKIAGRQQSKLSDLFATRTRKKAKFELLPSGRRHNVPKASKNIYKKPLLLSTTTWIKYFRSLIYLFIFSLALMYSVQLWNPF